MSDNKAKFKESYESASRFTRSVFDNFADGELPTEIRRDLKESYHFYLNNEDRQQLEAMGGIKRSLYSMWFLVKNLFMKLTPGRRVLVLIGTAIAFYGMSNETDHVLIGFVTLLFVLGLELKDKLMAHDQLEAGRAVQMAIMPHSIPDIPGWELWLYSVPANEVGGDLIDHMKLSENTVALTLGDIAGKGLPAALMAAKIQATVRAIALDYADLPTRIDRLNAIILRDGLREKFASLIHLEISAINNQIHFVNAGHHPPILVRATANNPVGKGGPAIGIARKAAFSMETVEMNQDDILVMYSDGITEARNEDGEFYSDERLEKLLQHTHGMDAEALGARVLWSVDQFVRRARPSDDISMIVIKRVSPA